MSYRLSFIVTIFVIYAGCIVLTSGAMPEPINNNPVGGFVDDFSFDTSQFIPSDDREKAQKLIEINHAVPRYTFFTSDMHLTRVPPLFCLPHGSSMSSASSEVLAFSSDTNETYSIDDCDWSDYAESLLLISFVAYIFAVIVFPIMFCGISLGRCCCFGKYQPTPELCCGDPEAFEATTNGYTNCSVLILFLLSIGCCAAMAAGAGVGLWGSNVMTNNVYDMANFTNETAHTFAEVLDSIVAILRNLNSIPNLTEVIDEKTLNDANDVSERIRNVTNGVAKYAGVIDMPRQIFMYITLLLPLVLMILVIVSRFCCWWLTWGMTFCGFILTFLSLCTFAFLYPLASGISDVCVFLDNSLANPDTDTFFNSVFSCGPDSILGDVTRIGRNVFETAENVSCEFYSTLKEINLPCDRDNDGIITVSDPMPASQLCSLLEFRNDTTGECNASSFSELSKTARIYDRKIGCYCMTDNPLEYKLQFGSCGTIHSLYDYPDDACPSTSSSGKPCVAMYCENKDDTALPFSQCVDSCSDQGMAANASYVLNYTKIAEDIFDLYYKQIKPYLNCESVVDITTHAKDFICVHMMNSVTPMYVGEIVGAAGCFVGTFVALLSTKRFRKRYRKKYAILKEGQTAIEL